MDLGLLLESPQGRKSSSRVGACMCAFLPSCSSLSRFPLRGSSNLWLSLEVSHEGFSRDFPTGLSHGPSWCESILGLKDKTVQEKQVSLEWTRYLGDSGNGGTTLQFLLPFLWRAPPLEMLGNARNSFPTAQGKDPSSLARRRKRGSSGCGRDSRASFRVETGMSGNFLSSSKGVKDPLEFPEVSCY